MRLHNEPIRRWLFVAVMAMGLFACVRAMAAPVDETNEDQKETMFTLIKKGGLVMYPLGLCSVVALALAAERFISLRREKIIPRDFVDSLLPAWQNDRSGHEAIKVCEQTVGPVGKIFKAGLQRMNRGEEAVEKAIEDAGYREAAKLKRSLKGLSIIASISPLLGLAGTVYGMIAAFETAYRQGMGSSEQLAKGIYEALVTTAAGLTIAIPTLLVYQYLSNRVDGIVDELDEMGLNFIVFTAHDGDAPDEAET